MGQQGRIRILLVDDDRFILSTYGRILGRSCEVSLCSEAEQALQLLETRTMDVIVSDLEMPGKNGLELLEEVAVRWPSVVRILWSGASRSILLPALDSGILHHCLAKPATPGTLMNAMNASLKAARGNSDDNPKSVE